MRELRIQYCIKRNLVRNSVEKTLNELLNQEADRLVNAQRYERLKILTKFINGLVLGLAITGESYW